MRSSCILIILAFITIADIKLTLGETKLLVEISERNTTGEELWRLLSAALRYANSSNITATISDVNECESTTLNTCSEYANCHNKNGSFSCSCLPNFLDLNTALPGTNCRDIDECQEGTHNCSENSFCNNTIGGYECVCNGGYVKSGLNCTDVDECVDGIDKCSLNANCTNVRGNYSCECNPGFTGDGFSCADINECKSTPCHVSATCTNTDGSYLCSCESGFSGNGTSCSDVDECLSNPCHDEASCVNTLGSYNCTCKEGFSGNGTICSATTATSSATTTTESEITTYEPALDSLPPTPEVKVTTLTTKFPTLGESTITDSHSGFETSSSTGLDFATEEISSKTTQASSTASKSSFITDFERTSADTNGLEKMEQSTAKMSLSATSKSDTVTTEVYDTDVTSTTKTDDDSTTEERQTTTRPSETSERRNFSESITSSIPAVTMTSQRSISNTSSSTAEIALTEMLTTSINTSTEFDFSQTPFASESITLTTSSNPDISSTEVTTTLAFETGVTTSTEVHLDSVTDELHHSQQTTESPETSAVVDFSESITSSVPKYTISSQVFTTTSSDTDTTMTEMTTTLAFEAATTETTVDTLQTTTEPADMTTKAGFTERMTSLIPDRTSFGSKLTKTSSTTEALMTDDLTTMDEVVGTTIETKTSRQSNIDESTFATTDVASSKSAQQTKVGSTTAIQTTEANGKVTAVTMLRTLRTDRTSHTTAVNQATNVTEIDKQTDNMKTTTAAVTSPEQGIINESSPATITNPTNSANQTVLTTNQLPRNTTPIVQATEHSVSTTTKKETISTTATKTTQRMTMPSASTSSETTSKEIPKSTDHVSTETKETMSTTPALTTHPLEPSTSATSNSTTAKTMSSLGTQPTTSTLISRATHTSEMSKVSTASGGTITPTGSTVVKSTTAETLSTQEVLDVSTTSTARRSQTSAITQTSNVAPAIEIPPFDGNVSAFIESLNSIIEKIESDPTASLNINNAGSTIDNFEKLREATQFNSDIASPVISIINGLAGAAVVDSGETAVDSNTSAKITLFVTDVLENMKLPAEGFTQEAENIVVYAVDEDFSVANSISFPPENVTTTAVIQLPEAFVQSGVQRIARSVDTEAHRLAFSEYSDSRLFVEENIGFILSDQTPNTAAFANEAEVVNSAVLGASVGGKEIINSDEKAKITLNKLFAGESSTNFDNGTSEIATFIGNPRCVWWNYSKNGWSDEGCELVETTESSIICECNHLTHFAVIMTVEKFVEDEVLTYLSYAGAALSIIGLAFTILTYSLFQSLRKSRSKKVLLHFCTALCGVYITYVLGIAAKLPANQAQCSASGFFMHFFTLSVMAWMSVEVFDMYIMFVKVISHSINKYMLKASLIAWGLPFIAAIIPLGVHLGYPDRGLYPKFENDRTVCWLGTSGMLYAFIIPSCIILITNLILFTIVLYKLTCGRKHSIIGRIGRSSQRNVKATQHVVNALTLLLLAGPTWIIGYFINVEPIQDGVIRRILSYVFVLLNAFQGFWIFIVFCIRPVPVRRRWQRLLTKGKLDDVSAIYSQKHTTTRTTLKNSSAVDSTSTKVRATSYKPNNSCSSSISSSSSSSLDSRQSPNNSPKNSNLRTQLA